jgi:DNA-binding XRE family transcriptional regulator
VSTLSKKRQPEDVRSLNARNTHDWCKGRKGIEHRYAWFPSGWSDRQTGLAHSEELICRECGKKNGYRQPSYPFGKLVEAYRRQAGITQTELADRMGVTQARISMIESDRIGTPNLKTVARVAHALGAEYSFRFAGLPIGVDGYEEPADWVPGIPDPAPEEPKA